MISYNDLSILKNRSWITSSTIDSHILSLNINSNDEYF